VAEERVDKDKLIQELAKAYRELSMLYNEQEIELRKAIEQYKTLSAELKSGNEKSLKLIDELKASWMSTIEAKDREIQALRIKTWIFGALSAALAGIVVYQAVR
jgi:hypothetical protein